MKKKQLTYVLLVVVAAIWGFIFYKFFSDIGGQPDINYQTKSIAVLPIKADTTEETFILMADYRDPFLGTLYRPQTFSAANKKSGTPKKEIKFPAIVYMGLISNTEGKKKIGMLKVDGKDHMVKVKDKIGQLEIIVLTKNSVEVRVGKEKREFGK